MLWEKCLRKTSHHYKNVGKIFNNKQSLGLKLFSPFSNDCDGSY